MTASQLPGSSPPDIEVYDDSMETEKLEKPPIVEDPFGNEESGEVKYRVMKWW
jgi:hypothetical protein